MLLRGNVYSPTLGMNTPITVVGPKTPPPREECKVAFLLHGLGGDNDAWAHYTMLPDYARRGKTLYILPAVGRSFYTDMRFGQKYCTYITQDLPAFAKALFNIPVHRENTLVMGGSMGGYGALKAAFARPEVFGMCAAFASGCLFLRDNVGFFSTPEGKAQLADQFGEQLIQDFEAMFGPELACGPQDDLPTALRQQAKNAPRPRLYLSCGTQDAFFEDHQRFTDLLRSLDYPFVSEEWEADHNYDFFNEALQRAIKHFDL